MSYYSELRVKRAIEAARRNHRWECTIQCVESQEYGVQDLHSFYVTIDGQYAETDAEEFFNGFGFHAVRTEYTTHSFAEMRIDVVGS